jgi:NAD(P)-dependent dehydrogenase (short-subunit alcohol dehydrogenase family)
MTTNTIMANREKETIMQQFEDKTILITGGNSGMGRAIAYAFSQKNANVVLVGRTEKTLRETAMTIGARASWYKVDVSNGDTVRAMVSDVLTHMSTSMS